MKFLRISMLLLYFISMASNGTTIKFSPDYPESAVSECIEGWVMVEFTVLPDGTTANHRVLESKPEGVFEKSAIDSLKKLNYSHSPNFKNEKVEGVQFKMSYKLDEGSSKYAHCNET